MYLHNVRAFEKFVPVSPRRIARWLDYEKFLLRLVRLSQIIINRWTALRFGKLLINTGEHIPPSLFPRSRCREISSRFSSFLKLALAAVIVVPSAHFISLRVLSFFAHHVSPQSLARRSFLLLLLRCELTTILFDDYIPPENFRAVCH